MWSYVRPAAQAATPEATHIPITIVPVIVPRFLRPNWSAAIAADRGTVPVHDRPSTNAARNHIGSLAANNSTTYVSPRSTYTVASTRPLPNRSPNQPTAI